MRGGARLIKLVALLRQPTFRRTLLRHRVAAAVEHVGAIRFCTPATLLDVGANKGQFSILARMLWPDALIHAFEPLPAAADRFAAVFRDDPRTCLHRVALGREAGTATFYVTDREDSSSLLQPGSGQKEAFGVGRKSEIEVPVVRLDGVVGWADLPRPILLKIDVQGGEQDVLRGIADLERLDFLYIELSFVELYEGQALFEEIREYLATRGFLLRDMFNQAFTTRFGPTQADCLFVRNPSADVEKQG